MRGRYMQVQKGSRNSGTNHGHIASNHYSSDFANLGEADKRSPLSGAYQMRNAIHGAKLEIIPGAGHVSKMEKPIQFNKAVKDFCLSLSTPK